MDLSIDLSCSPPEGQYKRKHRSYSEFTRNEFYDNFSMHFFKIYAEKTCTEVVTVLTIHNALVICSLVLMKLYRSPARQIHRKIPNCALSGKIIPAKYGESHFIGSNLITIVQTFSKTFQPRTSQQGRIESFCQSQTCTAESKKNG